MAIKRKYRHGWGNNSLAGHYNRSSPYKGYGGRKGHSYSKRWY